MKSEPRISANKRSRHSKVCVDGSTRDQLVALILPSVVALGITWWGFASVSDLALSVVLGCLVFATITPILTSSTGGRTGRPK